MTNKYKVGDDVWVKAKVTGVDGEDGDYGVYEIRVENGIMDEYMEVEDLKERDE